MNNTTVPKDISDVPKTTVSKPVADNDANTEDVDESEPHSNAINETAITDKDDESNGKRPLVEYVMFKDPRNTSEPNCSQVHSAQRLDELTFIRSSILMPKPVDASVGDHRVENVNNTLTLPLRNRRLRMLHTQGDNIGILNFKYQSSTPTLSNMRTRTPNTLNEN